MFLKVLSKPSQLVRKSSRSSALLFILCRISYGPLLYLHRFSPEWNTSCATGLSSGHSGKNWTGDLEIILQCAVGMRDIQQSMQSNAEDRDNFGCFAHQFEWCRQHYQNFDWEVKISLASIKLPMITLPKRWLILTNNCQRGRTKSNFFHSRKFAAFLSRQPRVGWGEKGCPWDRTPSEGI